MVPLNAATWSPRSQLALEVGEKGKPIELA